MGSSQPVASIGETGGMTGASSAHCRVCAANGVAPWACSDWRRHQSLTPPARTPLG